MHAAQAVEKAKERFKAKTKQYEDLRIRLSRQRQLYVAAAQQRKQERMRLLMEERRARSPSED
jgi:hypothetical protein